MEEKVFTHVEGASINNLKKILSLENLHSSCISNVSPSEIENRRVDNVD